MLQKLVVFFCTFPLPLAILLYNSYQIDRKSIDNYTKYQKVSTILTKI